MNVRIGFYRFHVVSEFDDSKRSFRRRLVGHNERRRKNSQDSLARNNTSEDNESKNIIDK
ncbi:hypothetical protein Lal_00035253 [Lupinus albus]|nr:hypothetical protein Lal_00035253 [Lupinus albus]